MNNLFFFCSVEFAPGSFVVGLGGDDVPPGAGGRLRTKVRATPPFEVHGTPI